MKLYSSLLLFLITTFSYAQESKSIKYWVAFSDKKDSPFSINQPEKYLSKKAIERRKIFNITITEQDFPVNPSYKQRVAKTGVEILNSSRWLNGISIQTDDEQKIKRILSLDFVTEVKKIGVHSKKDNLKKQIVQEIIRANSDLEDTVTLTEEDYGYALNQVKMLNGVKMHQNGFTGKGVVIAVLDGGFLKVNKIKTFEHLFLGNQILGTWDFIQLDSNVYDDNNHGMNVLSCIAARTKGKMIGTAPDAKFWLLRTEDANTEYIVEEYNWVCGAEFADSAGADIINSSLGYTTFDDETMNHSYKDLDGEKSVCTQAATIAAKKGIIVCNAAGNEGNDDWKYLGAPADAEGILTVGGVKPDKAHASFSSFGPTSDGRIKPTVAAQASNTIVASVVNRFYPAQGTSFASPTLCGMVACLRQANPQKTVDEVIKAIEFSATQYHNPDTILGSGIPNFVLANQYLGGDKNFNYKKNQVAVEPDKNFNNTLSFTVYSPQYDNCLVSIENAEGKIILRKSILPNAKNPLGFHKVNLSIPENVPNGIYICTIKIGKEVQSYNISKE